jgi:hypothetical protein
MGICWWGVCISRIACKEVGHVGELELWAPSCFVSCSRGVSGWGCRGYGGSEYGNLHWDPFCLGREGWFRNHLRWM